MFTCLGVKRKTVTGGVREISSLKIITSLRIAVNIVNTAAICHVFSRILGAFQVRRPVNLAVYTATCVQCRSELLFIPAALFLLVQLALSSSGGLLNSPNQKGNDVQQCGKRCHPGVNRLCLQASMQLQPCTKMSPPPHEKGAV